MADVRFVEVDEMKAWIAKASYEQLMRRWRYESMGSPWFQGEVGDLFAARVRQVRQQVGQKECIRVSKALGWE